MGAGTAITAGGEIEMSTMSGGGDPEDWYGRMMGLPADRRAVVSRMLGEVCGAMSRDLAAWKAAGAEGSGIEAFQAASTAVRDRLVAEDPEAAWFAYRAFVGLLEERFGRGTGA